MPILVYDTDPSILISKTIINDYCAKSNCPSFKAFLQDIFSKDQNIIFYVQLIAEYYLTRSTLEQYI